MKFTALLLALCSAAPAFAQTEYTIDLDTESKVVVAGEITAGQILFLTQQEYIERFHKNQLRPIDLVIVQDFPTELDSFPLAGVVTNSPVQENCHMASQAEMIRIPLIKIKDAFSNPVLRSLNGQIVSFRVDGAQKKIWIQTGLSEAEAVKIFQSRFQPIRVRPYTNVYRKIQPLSEVPPDQIVHYGHKLENRFRASEGKAGDSGFPDTIGVPEDIDRFISESVTIQTADGSTLILRDAVLKQISKMKELGMFSPEVPRLLQEIQSWFDQVEDDSQIMQPLITQIEARFKARGGIFAALRFRSSNRIENLLGAGVYRSIFLKANELVGRDVRIKQIWNAYREVLKSKYSFNAYLLRTLFGVDEANTDIAVGVHLSEDSLKASGVGAYEETKEYKKSKIISYPPGGSGTSPLAGSFYEQIYVFESRDGKRLFSKSRFDDRNLVEDPHLTTLAVEDLLEIHEKFKLANTRWRKQGHQKPILNFEWGVKTTNGTVLFDVKDSDDGFMEIDQGVPQTTVRSNHQKKSDDFDLLRRNAWAGFQPLDGLDAEIVKKIHRAGLVSFGGLVSSLLRSEWNEEDVTHGTSAFCYYLVSINGKTHLLASSDMKTPHPAYVRALEDQLGKLQNPPQLKVLSLGTITPVFSSKLMLREIAIDQSRDGNLQPQTLVTILKTIRSSGIPFSAGAKLAPITAESMKQKLGARTGVISLNELMSGAPDTQLTGFNAFPGLDSKIVETIHANGFLNFNEEVERALSGESISKIEEIEGTYYLVSINGKIYFLSGVHYDRYAQIPFSALVRQLEDLGDRKPTLSLIHAGRFSAGVSRPRTVMALALNPFGENSSPVDAKTVIQALQAMDDSGIRLARNGNLNYWAASAIRDAYPQAEGRVTFSDALRFSHHQINEFPGLDAASIRKVHAAGFVSFNEEKDRTLSESDDGPFRMKIKFYFLVSIQGRHYFFITRGQSARHKDLAVQLEKALDGTDAKVISFGSAEANGSADGHLHEILISKSNDSPTPADEQLLKEMSHAIHSSGVDFDEFAKIGNSSIAGKVAWNSVKSLLGMGDQTAGSENFFPGLSLEAIRSIHSSGLLSVREAIREREKDSDGQTEIGGLAFLLKIDGSYYFVVDQKKSHRDLHSVYAEKLGNRFNENLRLKIPFMGYYTAKISDPNVINLINVFGKPGEELDANLTKNLFLSIEKSGMRIDENSLLQGVNEQYSALNVIKKEFGLPTDEIEGKRVTELPIYAVLGRGGMEKIARPHPYPGLSPEIVQKIKDAGLKSLADSLDLFTNVSPFFKAVYFEVSIQGKIYFLVAPANEKFVHAHYYKALSDAFFPIQDRTQFKIVHYGSFKAELSSSSIMNKFEFLERAEEDHESMGVKDIVSIIESIHQSGIQFDESARLEGREAIPAIRPIFSEDSDHHEYFLNDILTDGPYWVWRRGFSEVNPETSKQLEELELVSLTSGVKQVLSSSPGENIEGEVPFLAVKFQNGEMVFVSYDSRLTPDQVMSKIKSVYPGAERQAQGLLKIVFTKFFDGRGTKITKISFPAFSLERGATFNLRSIFNFMEEVPYLDRAVQPIFVFGEGDRDFRTQLDALNAKHGGYGSFRSIRELPFTEILDLFNGKKITLIGEPFSDLYIGARKRFAGLGLRDFGQTFQEGLSQAQNNEFNIASNFILLKVAEIGGYKGDGPITHHRLVSIDPNSGKSFDETLRVIQEHSVIQEGGGTKTEIQVVHTGEYEAKFAKPNLLRSLKFHSGPEGEVLTAEDVYQVLKSFQKFGIVFDHDSQLLFTYDVAHALSPISEFSKDGTLSILELQKIFSIWTDLRTAKASPLIHRLKMELRKGSGSQQKNIKLSFYDAKIGGHPFLVAMDNKENFKKQLKAMEGRTADLTFGGQISLTVHSGLITAISIKTFADSKLVSTADFQKWMETIRRSLPDDLASSVSVTLDSKLPSNETHQWTLSNGRREDREARFPPYFGKQMMKDCNAILGLNSKAASSSSSK